MCKQTKTGQLRQSKISNCPIFIPSKISEAILSQQRVATNEINNTDVIDEKFNDILKLYFYKFFAGDKSLLSGFADIEIQDLYLWKNAKIADSVYVKTVVKVTQNFSKVIENLTLMQQFSAAKLIQHNTLLRPKDKIHGIRKKSIRAGDPQNNKYAFYCVPAPQIAELLDDLLKYFNANTNESTINKALIGMLQFIYIHPFKDGNGRITRALFLAMLQPNYGLPFSAIFLLYLKNINRMNYYSAMQQYREGNIAELKKFYLQTISWVNKSVKLLSGFLDDYIATVGQNNFDRHTRYSQIIVKVNKNEPQTLRNGVFKLHSSKGQNNIYLNTALLNALNQFDYYLRYELRKHRQLGF